MVTLPVSLEVVVLSEPLPTHLAGVPVLALIRPVEDLVDPQLVLTSESLAAGGALEGRLPRVRHFVVPQFVFPSESLATGGTLVGRLTRVGHLMIPEQLQPVVLDRAVSALVAVEVEVFLHDVSLQLRTAFKCSFAGITEERSLASVHQTVGLQTRGRRESLFT